MPYITIAYPGMNWADVIIDALITDKQSPAQLAEVNAAITEQMDLGYLVKVMDRDGTVIGDVPRSYP